MQFLVQVLSEIELIIFKSQAIEINTSLRLGHVFSQKLRSKVK